MLVGWVEGRWRVRKGWERRKLRIVGNIVLSRCLRGVVGKGLMVLW